MVSFRNSKKYNEKSCPKCSTELTLVEKTFDTYGYCSNCWDFRARIIDDKKCCNVPNQTLVKHVIRDGRIQVRSRCLNCEDMPVNPIRQKGIDLDSLISSDKNAQGVYEKLRDYEFDDFMRSVDKQFAEKTKVRPEIFEFRVSYDEFLEYYSTPQWKVKRRKVLERDNYTCQCCGKRKAEQVHHKTYRYFKKEPLFDLVSVCVPCHNEITLIDQGPNYEWKMEEVTKNQYKHQA